MKTLFLAFAVSAAAAGTASAEVPRLALAAVIEEAVANNPEIQAARRRVDAARQRPAQENSLPDPMVSAGWSSTGKPFPGAGLGEEPMANIGVMVRQELPYPGKLSLRAAMSGKEADAEARQLEAVRLNVVSRVKQAYYRLGYAATVLEVLDRNNELLETLLEVGETRYGVGAGAQQDVFKAQAELTVVELQRERLRQERVTRAAELNALLNRAPGAPLGDPEPLSLPPFAVTAEALIAQARELAPMLLRDAAMIERAEIGVESARKDYLPDFAVSGGYFNQGSMPAMYEFRFDVVVPLARARRAAAVRERAALLEEARASRTATERTIEARVQEEFRTATAAARLATLYRDALLPQVRLALESSLASYQTGAVDFLSVLTNFGSQLDAEMRYFEELMSFHVAASRLEEMTGAPLVH